MPKRFGGGRQKPELSGMQYNQDGKKLVPGTDGRTKKGIKRFNYDQWGHYADKCPEKEEDEAKQMLQKQQHDKNESEVDDVEVQEEEGMQ